jgi:hypothetical protein
VLPSPYASSFGGFVEVATTVWFAAGGVVSSAYEAITRRKPAPGEVPADMSTTSLVGGGLIAGDALAALTIGILGLIKALL